MNYKKLWENLYTKLNNIIHNNDKIIHDLIVSNDSNKATKIIHKQIDNAAIYKIKMTMDIMEEGEIND